MPTNASHKPAKKVRNDVQVLARKALLQLFEPLIGFVLDSGLSTSELHSVLREAAVRTVAARQMDVARRVNISGIAASTGIPRGEISRILKSNEDSSRQFTDRRQQSTNRILSVWHQDPKFTTPAGKPADLKIYGKGATFEALVRSYGRGIPTRAMLDELTRAGAVEVLSSRLVRVKTLVAVDRGVTPRVIRSFGERATELLSTMLQNMRNPDNPQFIASISEATLPTVLPLIRKELANKGADFLADIHDLLIRDTTDETTKPRSSRSSRVSVTIYYHESQHNVESKSQAVRKRRNLRRND